MKLSWYLNRLRRMSAAEMSWRARNKALEALWRRRAGAAWPVSAAGASAFVFPALSGPCAGEHTALLATAEAILTEPWPIFDGHADLTAPAPDWDQDPRAGGTAPDGRYCFDIRYRDVANIKHRWELSRLHHVTVLAAAYNRSGDARFADHAVAHLQSWWRQNPPLMGTNWVSGIEIGLRLIAMVWTRRLLATLPGIEQVFEANPVFRQQLHAHQAWIATFYSRYSSANNHVIAEMAGLSASALAFPLFPESRAWAGLAASVLTSEVALQTFADGMNRELASDYHVFVLELALIAGAEADLAGQGFPDAFWGVVCRMADALAAIVDARGRTGRQGDSDSGHALVMDPPAHTPVATVLAVCAQVFGAGGWWPEVGAGGVTADCLNGMIRPRRDLPLNRPGTRPNHFPDAGIAIARDLPGSANEIWCRFDHGPHGFLATTAHAHADALSVEVRIGGQEILIDPGTYCYHDERPWRDYFRSTIAHNTLEVGGRDQAVQAGPFLWLGRPETHLTTIGETEVEAWHDGYTSSAGTIRHHRKISVDRAARSLTIADRLTAPAVQKVRLAFHFHPAIEVALTKDRVELGWGPAESRQWASMTLPGSLTWRLHRGQRDPILGWYSPGFAERRPTNVIVGFGELTPGEILRSRMVFAGSLPAELRILAREMAA